LLRLSTEEPEDMDALNKELEDVSSKNIVFLLFDVGTEMNRE